MVQYGRPIPCGTDILDMWHVTSLDTWHVNIEILDLLLVLNSNKLRSISVSCLNTTGLKKKS